MWTGRLSGGISQQKCDKIGWKWAGWKVEMQGFHLHPQLTPFFSWFAGYGQLCKNENVKKNFGKFFRHPNSGSIFRGNPADSRENWDHQRSSHIKIDLMDIKKSYFFIVQFLKFFCLSSIGKNGSLCKKLTLNFGPKSPKILQLFAKIH